MRKTLLLTMVLLAVSAWGIAQQDANSQNAPNNNQGATQPSAGGNSVQGCLGASGNSFTVTDKSGTSYQLQLPPGADTSNLKPHIGEEVRVEGTMANSGGGANSSAGSSSAGQRAINVKNIYRISSTCSTKAPSGNPK